MTTFAALAAGELLARYANKKLPDVIGKYSGALGGFAAYATPAAIIALALLAKKMSKGGQFVQLATNQAIGASIADAFSVAFPNVISGLGMDSPLQGGEYQYRLTEPNAAVPYPASLQGIPKINSYTAEPGNYREYAY
jgi:hypothetical protein